MKRNSEAVIDLVEKWIPDTCTLTLLADFKKALQFSCKETGSKKVENPIFHFIRSNSDGEETAVWLQDALFGTADNSFPRSDEPRILLFGLHILFCGMQQKMVHVLLISLWNCLGHKRHID